MYLMTQMVNEWAVEEKVNLIKVVRAKSTLIVIPPQRRGARSQKSTTELQSYGYVPLATARTCT